MAEQGFFIELPDSGDGGHRYHADARPIVIRGSIVPVRPGAGAVIVVEQPADLAVTVRAVPVTNWVKVETQHVGPITEREYARLLARVPGILQRYVAAVPQRAMGPSKLEKRATNQTRATKSQREVGTTSRAELGAVG